MIENTCVVFPGQVRWRRELTVKGYERIFVYDRKFLYHDYDDGT